MKWNDALTLRPIRNGGVYVLACPAKEGGGVEIMLGSYRDQWLSGGKKVPAIYFAAVDGLPEDTAEKAKQINDILQDPPMLVTDEEILEEPEIKNALKEE